MADDTDNTEMEDTQDDVSTESKAPDNDSGVALSEEFQQETTDIIQQATMPELEFMKSLIMEREKEIHKSKSPGAKSGTFDTVGMPQIDD